MTITLEQELNNAHQMRQTLSTMQEQHQFVIPKVYDSLEIFAEVLQQANWYRKNYPNLKTGDIIEEKALEIIDYVKKHWQEEMLPYSSFKPNYIVADTMHTLVCNKIAMLVLLADIP